MIPRERTPYSAIVDRPKLRLPGGARLVVWTIVNLEFWDISRPMARQVLPAPTGQVLLPDVPYPLDAGAKIRNDGLLRLLAADHEVDAIAFCEPAGGAELAKLVQRCAVVPMPSLFAS